MSYFSDPENLKVGDERLILPDDMDLWDIAVMVVRGKLTLSPQQMRVLIEMFPYLRPKLSATAIATMDGKSFAEALDRAIARSRGETPMLSGSETLQLDASELKKPMAQFRRF